MWDFNRQDIKPTKLRQWAQDLGSTCDKCDNLWIKSTTSKQVDNWSLFAITTPGILRTSLLYVDQSPWMFAQAWTDRDNNYLVEQLKNDRPLGSWLFTPKNQLKRSQFNFAKPDFFMNLVSPNIPVLARHSYFDSASLGSLLLLEVFLQHEMWL